MLSHIFSILILGLSQAHSQSQCPNLVDDIYFAGYPSDLAELDNCSHLNSSLFITGDYNIWSLQHLENLNTIDGYLVVLDSHLIKNLKGLHNLQSIEGNEKYLKTSSVTFKYNNNFLDDENRGLCFTDLVNWTKITEFDVVDTNNGIDCPTECHTECIGCFGPGPRLCQECRHSQVGDTCVNYDCLQHSCDLFTPLTPLEISFQRPHRRNLNISWNELNISTAGGNIQEYLLYRDGELISHQYFNDSGYETQDSLDTFYLDTNLTLDIIYFYRIEYVTESGSLSSDEFSYHMYDWLPDSISNLSVQEFIPISFSLVNSRVGFTSITNGVPYQFKFSLWKEGVVVMEDTTLPVDSFLDTNQIILTNLEYVTPYHLEVYGFNTEYSVRGETGTLDFTTPLAPTTTTISTTTISTTTVSSTSSTNSDTTISSSTTSDTTSTSSITSTITETSTNTITSTHTGTSTNTGTSTTPTFTSISLTTTIPTTVSSSNTNYTSSVSTLTKSTTISTPSSTLTTSMNSNKGLNMIPDLDTNTHTTTTEKSDIKIGSLNNNERDSNSTIINFYNTTHTDKDDDLPWFIILIIILSTITLIVCFCLVCGDCSRENEVAPMPHTSGYANPCYHSQVIESVDVVLNSDSNSQQSQNSFKRTANPLYSSDSSLNSQDETKPKYDEVARPCVQNQTYGSVQQSNGRLATNQTYGFPEETNTDTLDNTYDFCIPDNTQASDNTQLSVSRKLSTGEMLRPSSAYQDINRVHPPESKQFELKTGLKNYRPTVRKEITDESISRRKGNLMSELQKSIQKRGNQNFDI